MKNKKAINTIAIISVIIVIFTAMCLTVWGTCEYHKNSKTPLGWCIWEIHKHEYYDCDFTYYYKDLEPKSEIKKEADKGCEIYCYYITTFTDEYKTEWYCFFEGFHRNWFDHAFECIYYRPDEVYIIDCDEAFIYEIQ